MNVGVGAKDDVPLKEADVASKFGMDKMVVDSPGRKWVPDVSAAGPLAVNVWK